MGDPGDDDVSLEVSLLVAGHVHFHEQGLLHQVLMGQSVVEEFQRELVCRAGCRVVVVRLLHGRVGRDHVVHVDLSAVVEQRGKTLIISYSKTQLVNN